ncbi:ATP-binding protein [Streptomyces hoynatensis]|uniref:ATP-binding protein n=1 Tax=Streptomyces hoynatensis TaxID=1141874 RepID=UPI00187FC7F5|nr:ATP-binding protein [Streptomyces hoynatensis]
MPEVEPEALPEDGAEAGAARCDRPGKEEADVRPLRFPPARFTRCPPPPELDEPHPGNLAYSFTMPCAASTPLVARETAATVFDVHRLGELFDPALLLVRELVSCACRFTEPGEEVFLSLRHREQVLRLTVYDTHERHAHPLLAASCDRLRRAALRLTPELVGAHGGAWGFAAAQHPGTGTRTWATLRRAARGA